MKRAEKTTSICTTCGSPIDPPSADLGCVVCLLNAGFEDSEESEKAELPPGQVSEHFGSYRIVRREDGSFCELGRGAMGVTYQALDTSLNRAVALKIIQSDLRVSNGEARERFMREARAAASLRHPNIATVYQFGIREESGQCFCAMELIEGETLHDRVRRTGPLDVRSVVEIARQIAAALGEAEKRGLVHRDLKPANIMIQSAETDGAEAAASLVVKIIDFGIAKALAETPDTRVLTQHGFIGTPAFASPEQFSGAPVDVRSDIYSLGATLWYLLTGHMPFGDRVNAEIGKAFVAPPVEQLKAAHVPSSVAVLLVSMLATEPAARPGVRDLTSKLEKIHAQLAGSRKSLQRFLLAAVLSVLAASGAFFVFHSLDTRSLNDPGQTPAKSIAVLPFEDLSDEKNNAHFADGIQDDVLTSLAKIQNLKVISRTSVMSFRKSGARNLRAIGKELGAANVLEGSVRRAGNRVLVNVQLIDAATDQHIWAERYDRTLADSITLQGELASEIAGALRATLSSEEKARVETKYTDNPDAYVAYLRGREAHLRPETSREDYVTAEAFYKQAITLDPKFVLARARLSFMQALLYAHFEPTNPPKRPFAWTRVPQKRTALTRRELATAVRLVPNDASVLMAAAIIQQQFGWDEEALANYKRATELGPREPKIFYNYGSFLWWDIGQEAEARVALDRALELAPESVLFRLARALAEISWTGDLSRVKTILAGLPAGKDPDGRVTSAYITVAILERNFAEASRLLRAYAGETLPTGSEGIAEPKALSEGFIRLYAGDRAGAYECFESVRENSEANVRDNPQSPEAHAGLAILYAQMAWKEAALAEAARVIELETSASVPPKHRHAVTLASAYTWAGEPDLALQQLEQSLAQPSAYTMHNFRLNPVWDPLRNDPRFQKFLVAKKL